MNAFYGRNSHFLYFGENLSQSLMEKNVKFVLNDVKATAFSSSERHDIRASFLVMLHNNVLQHPDLNCYMLFHCTMVTGCYSYL